MDMSGSASSDACKISMLWNWYTLNSCFISSTWHVRTKAQFAGTVIGVFFLVIAIEALRRFGREYDRRLVFDGKARAAVRLNAKTDEDGEPVPFVFLPSWGQQVLRSFVYGSQFTASFLVMLLGMYYNGYILFAIFLGHSVGYCFFGRDTVGGGHDSGGASGHCC